MARLIGPADAPPLTTEDEMTAHERARWVKLVSDLEASDMTLRELASQRGILFSNLLN